MLPVVNFCSFGFSEDSANKATSGTADCRQLPHATLPSTCPQSSPKSFKQAYRELRPRTPAPPMHVRFYPFVSINNTIRLRQGELYIRLSDLLEGAPEPVLHAIAHILLAKLYRKPVDRAQSARYRRYVASHDLPRRRGSSARCADASRSTPPAATTTIWKKSSTTSTAASSTDSWDVRNLPGAANHARNRLGHYDPAHNTIVISRVFDDPRVPRYAVEYILFHEMLHLKHPVKLQGQPEMRALAGVPGGRKTVSGTRAGQKFLRI